jgi:hypothetical protein
MRVGHQLQRFEQGPLRYIKPGCVHAYERGRINEFVCVLFKVLDLLKGERQYRVDAIPIAFGLHLSMNRVVQKNADDTKPTRYLSATLKRAGSKPFIFFIDSERLVVWFGREFDYLTVHCHRPVRLPSGRLTD